MKKSESVKEKIISITIGLIQDSGGAVETITIRMIAQRAGIGVGLINYHFKSKDQLIEVCVQRMIGTVIASFKPNVLGETDPIKKLKTVAKLVADFLIDNPSVSKISILGDMVTPMILDNTMKTVFGFSLSLADLNISEDQKKILLFSLTSILQALFLRRDISKESFGFDFNKKEERDHLLDFMIDRLFGGIKIDENPNH